METTQLQIFAGAISSMLFVRSNLPMILKVMKTKIFKSFSPGHLARSNMGNLLHWVYIASLPVGLIWYLHGFNSLLWRP